MSKRLLVVDDEPNLLRAVAACLQAEGYEVKTARSGADALVSLAESIPDLIISDIRMPGMDGHALVHRLRASPRTALVPVIFLTAKDQKADRIEGFRTGIDAYVTKPFEAAPLAPVSLSRAMSGRRTVKRDPPLLIMIAGAKMKEGLIPPVARPTSRAATVVSTAETVASP